MDSALKLVLPTALVVTTFLGAGACRDQGHHYCEDIETEPKCNAEPGCGWDQQNGECTNSCSQIEDKQECEKIERCTWEASEASETGGEQERCRQVFT